MAVKNALSYVCGEQIPTLTTPATNEEILARLTQYKQEGQGQSFKPWFGADSPVLAKAPSFAKGYLFNASGKNGGPNGKNGAKPQVNQEDKQKGQSEDKSGGKSGAETCL